MTHAGQVSNASQERQGRAKHFCAAKTISHSSVALKRSGLRFCVRLSSKDVTNTALATQSAMQSQLDSISILSYAIDCCAFNGIASVHEFAQDAQRNADYIGCSVASTRMAFAV
jgi:hypothetical protein